MTVEELDIVVQASVDGALKEFQKIVPGIKQATKQISEQINKTNFNGLSGKIQQAVTQVKQKLENLKKSNTSNNLEIKVTTEDAKKQITQLQKEIDSLQEKINARKLKLDVISPQLDEIGQKAKIQYGGVVTSNGIIGKNKEINIGENSKEFDKLSAQESKLISEISVYNNKIIEAKSKIVQLGQEINQTATTQNKLGSFFGMFKDKIQQSISHTKNLKGTFNQMPKITQKITNNVKNIGTGIKGELKHVLKYAGALLSIRGLYGLLRGSANAWLSSQNAGAKQLSANIEYMKYAMGSALAPVIQFVINLVYKLMRAIQSVVYALTGVNIFAKASAKSYASMAGSAKKAKDETKQLLGVHDEIDNIQDNDSDSGSGGVTPSLDLSTINPIDSIIEAIKNGDWYAIGATIGEKLNSAMNNIPWNKIQNTARKISTNIAEFLNGFIAKTDWKQVGNTFAQGINTAIYSGQSFYKTFDFKELGHAIGNGLTSLIENIDWSALADGLSAKIKGIFNAITGFFETFDWNVVVDGLIDFIANFDWDGVADSIFEALGSACASLVNLGMIIGEKINEALDKAKQYFQEKIEECGGNIVDGIFKGIIDALANIGQWINEHIFKPFIEGFKNVFEIHSPSKIMAEQGKFIIQGLLEGITSLVDKVKEVWQKMKQTAIDTFSNIKTSITDKVNEIKDGITQKFKDAYENIKNIFGNIGGFFENVWNNVKNTFANLGTNIGEAISNSVKTGINNVISLIQNTMNKAIGLINGAIGVINAIPGVEITKISTLNLPRLAKGGVLYNETAFVGGEYSGAKTNPEIVTPQNIMYDTMKKALADSDINTNNNDRPINLAVYVGNKKIGQILLDELRDRKRQTGKDIEALVGG